MTPYVPMKPASPSRTSSSLRTTAAVRRRSAISSARSCTRRKASITTLVLRPSWVMPPAGSSVVKVGKGSAQPPRRALSSRRRSIFPRSLRSPTPWQLKCAPHDAKRGPAGRALAMDRHGGGCALSGRTRQHGRANRARPLRGAGCDRFGLLGFVCGACVAMRLAC